MKDRDTETLIRDYRQLMADVMEEAERLKICYGEHMKCRKGCSECCTDLTLLPLEWYALREVLKKENPPLKPAGQDDRCSLLVDDACALYPYRPLICRTHGLPLLYLTEEYNDAGIQIKADDPEWQISWCDLNFTEVSEEMMEDIFDPEDVINMEEWNLLLGRLNREFLKTPEGSSFQRKRIPLKEILS